MHESGNMLVVIGIQFSEKERLKKSVQQMNWKYFLCCACETKSKQVFFFFLTSLVIKCLGENDCFEKQKIMALGWRYNHWTDSYLLLIERV